MTPIELQHLIKDKCDAWLNPMGYSLNFSTSTYLAYSSDTLDANFPFPLITCKVEPNDTAKITVDLTAGGDIGMIQMTIQNLSFEHPYIVDFISNLRYASNCLQNMRKNPISQHYIKMLKNDFQEFIKNNKL